MENIYPCFWFDTNAQQAAELYCKAFPQMKISADSGMVVMLEYGDQNLMLLNGGPYFQINPSISVYVQCQSESEVESAWQLLSDGGKELMPLGTYDWSPKYGWLQDRFGVNWQLALGDIGINQKFIPTLMFTGEQNGNTLSAIEFYSGIFKNSGLKFSMPYSKEENEREGNLKHAQFHIGSTYFMAMDSSLNHEFSFNEAVSFVVNCANQHEIDYYWEMLTRGGQESQCGWLKDRFGVSWQIVPSILSSLMTDPQKTERVVSAFMKMKKFDIDTLINA